MKWKIASVVIAFAVLLTVLLCIPSICASSFGLCESVITVNAVTYPELEGDVEYIDGVKVIRGGNVPYTRFVHIVPKDGVKLISGTGRWADSEPIEILDRPMLSSYVEKRNGNGWELVPGTGISQEYDYDDKDEPWNLLWFGGRGQLSFTIWTSIYEPGEYRTTVYFREYTSGDSGFTTGEELHRISFEFVVPDASRSRWDVIDVLPYHGVQEPPLQQYQILLRANQGDGVFPYLDRESMQIERHTGDGYELLSSQHDGVPIIDYSYDTDERYVKPKTEENFACIPVTLGFATWGTQDVYRVTMDFTENPDGTGERYTLQLRLRFAEE